MVKNKDWLNRRLLCIVRLEDAKKSLSRRDENEKKMINDIDLLINAIESTIVYTLKKVK
jgi:hypothetical protein